MINISQVKRYKDVPVVSEPGSAWGVGCGPAGAAGGVDGEGGTGSGVDSSITSGSGAVDASVTGGPSDCWGSAGGGANSESCGLSMRRALRKRNFETAHYKAIRGERSL